MKNVSISKLHIKMATTLLLIPYVLAMHVVVDAGMLEPAAGIDPVTDSDFYQDGQYSEAELDLGQALFFDKILSGNRNISCSSCHHPTLGSTDGLSLPIGEGGSGIGRDRVVDPDQPVSNRVPRNSQSLFFRGATQFTRLFHDGRVAEDEHQNWPSGFWTPAREQLPAGLDNVLAAQAMFPVTSAVEMAGQKGENAIATAAALNHLGGEDGVWDLLAQRLRENPEYVTLFQAAFPAIESADDITFVAAANAIAAFEAVAFRADNSPFDTYLETRDSTVIGDKAYQGMELFYGEAGCAGCHGGKFLTDQQFHAIGMPQIGPGKNDGWDTGYWQTTGFMARLEDHGRGRESLREEDRFAFRTPSLRNVELTSPYGHAGAYQTLEETIRHHGNPREALQAFQVENADLPAVPHVVETTAIGSKLTFKPVNPKRMSEYELRDRWVMNSPAMRNNIAAASEIESIPLSDQDISDLVAFLESLTDPAHKNAKHLVPTSVPSGLSID